MMTRMVVALMLGVSIASAALCDVETEGCLIGAFIADVPTAEDIKEFESSYGKKPAVVMIYRDWSGGLDDVVLQTVARENCALCITWEPWLAHAREAIAAEAILSGQYDAYITQIAEQIKTFPGTVFLRFMHEMNGDWYPWSLRELGSEQYQKVYRYVHDRVSASDVTNVVWVYAVNFDNVPQEIDFSAGYPGDAYVDALGVDGYNWGATEQWSSWRSCADIFGPVLDRLKELYAKPLMITECGSTGAGGDKKQWIKDAMKWVRKRGDITTFFLFNINKETDWRFDPASGEGKMLRKQLSHDYFIGGGARGQ